jgi:hypothetical protein
LPTTAEHRAKAENNEFLVDQLDNPFWDWAVTAVFYAGLHYIEAYFASLAPALHPTTHQTRNSHVHANAKLSPIYIDYRQLEDDSRNARYDARMEFRQSDVAQARKYLERIKAVVIPLLP